MPDDPAPPPPPALPAPPAPPAPPPTVRMVSPQGDPIEIPAAEQQFWFRQGYTPDTTEAAVVRAGSAARAADLSTAGAFGQGIARTVTLGGSDVLQRLAGGEDARIHLEQLREARPTASFLGELGGVFVPTGAAGAVGRLGKGIAAIGEGAGLAGRLGAAAAGGAAEGLVYGAGQGVSELALSPDLSVEHIGSALSSNMLYSGELGAGLGAAGKAAELALQKARGVVQNFADRQAAALELKRTGAGAVTDADLVNLDAKALRAKAEAELDRLEEEQDATRKAERLASHGDVANLDAKGLRAARDTEMDRLTAEASAADAQERAAARSAAVDKAVAYRQVVKDSDPWLAMDDSGRSAPFTKATRSLRNAMDDVKGLRDNPAPVQKPLRVEEQALAGALADREAIAAKMKRANEDIAKTLSEELATLPDKAATVDLTGKAARRYASFTDAKLPRGRSLSIPREDAEGFLGALQRGEVTGEGQRALAKLPDLLEQNRALQTQIKESLAPPKSRVLTSEHLRNIDAARDSLSAPLKPRSELTSEHLTAIRAAQDAIAAPKAPASLGTQLLSHVAFGATAGAVGHIPILGHIAGPILGSKVADFVSGAMSKLGTAATESSMRAAKSAASFLNVAAKGAAKAPQATRVLAGLRYGPSDKKGEEQPRDLAGLYKARTDEIKRQVEIAPDGSFQMTQPAREAMAKCFDGIRPHDPILADKCEAHAARKITHLASQIPRMPDAFGSSIGPLQWHPPDMEMRSFARKAHAAEYPLDVFERVISGHVTPEDVSTMIGVYPEMRNAYISEFSSHLGTLGKALPYGRRIAMSIMTNVPIDPAMHPAVQAVLQNQFTAEVGSMGGTQPPKAQPQFGSVAKSLPAPTAAQTRAQGAHHP